MKKVMIIILVAALALMSIGMLVGCERDKTAKELITFNTYYVNSDCVGDLSGDVDRYMFFEDGTCNYEFKMHKMNDVIITKYKYIIVDETAMLFFHERVAGEGEPDVNNCFTLGVDKKVIMNILGGMYINEKYLEELPNFGKKVA